MAIGDIDKDGNKVIKEGGSAQLWETPKGNYLVYLWLDEKRNLHKCRANREEAYEIYNIARNIEI